MKKPASGKFQLRLSSEMHAKARKAAEKAGLSLNQFVMAAIIEKLEGK